MPQLPKPEFTLIHVKVPSEVPAQIAVALGKTGIPAGLIGYEYRPLNEAVFLEGIVEQGLVAIATSGLFGRVAVDVATGHVVQIPKVDSARAPRLVNSDLGSFNQCVAAVIGRFPFYADGYGDRYEVVAEELRNLIAGIDEATLTHNGFWETFCDDVAMGDYEDWDS
ncbi:SUKH-4 family immunity protein [Streptomyces sp. NPDC047081]|uniref:SUKH-4 family immunity protein n=1 Tax=Streptomyces sp. NPDC047081 TaxID=3154706 RepID=UPI0033F0FE54